MSQVFTLIQGKELERMPQLIKSYLHLGEATKRGDWYLQEDYIVIRLCGIKSTPHKLPKLLTPNTFFLEYVSQMIEVDNIHYLQSKKKARIVFPISMGGYLINHKRGIMTVLQIIKNLSLPLDSTWKYAPHFIIGKEK